MDEIGEIKMTGMPGFGPTHDEEGLWAMVAFVKRTPDIQAKEYEAMARKAEGGKKKIIIMIPRSISRADRCPPERLKL